MYVTNFLNRTSKQYPWAIILLLLVLVIVASLFLNRFELDASGESLVLENDTSIQYYREIRNRYGSDDFLIITYKPHGEVFSDDSLAGIRSLRDQLLQMDNVSSVISILDAPVIYQSGLRLSELGDELPVLEDSTTDRELVRHEILTNPFYKNQLVSSDGRTTALQVVFTSDEKFYQLQKRRNDLHKQELVNALNSHQQEELAEINRRIQEHNSKALQQWQEQIDTVRNIMDSERHRAEMYLGGVPMITSDMIRFIRHDLLVFGAGVMVFIVLILFMFFRSIRWVLLPLAACALTGITVIGLLGFLGWKVTVISSNFLSIILIITLSLNIHLVVRYRDLRLQQADMSASDLIKATIDSMFMPCFYTIFTTAIAFSSLIVSGIRPVIDFGWIMVIGLVLAFVISFLLFPSVLQLFPVAPRTPVRDLTRRIMLWSINRVKMAPVLIIGLFVLVSMLLAAGVPNLRVENRFIDNFRTGTEIYRGMIVIDREFGGTTPLDIILDADAEFIAMQDQLQDEFKEFDMLEDPDAESEQPGYWLEPAKIQRLEQLQEFLAASPVVGKVLSLSDTVAIAEHLNGAELDSFELSVLRQLIPDVVSDDIIKPFLSDDANQVRVSVRVKESDKSLNRQQLLQTIQTYLVNDVGLKPEQINLSGMLVLYNNMLQSLFRSQILTLGAVFSVIFLTFIIVFRSVRFALIGIIPNIFSTVFILGTMGWAGIPLDMMTITIASITIGIAVDDTIHYIHRLKREFSIDRDYTESLSRCHGGIGKAMYYTSLVIIFGFAILALSNFIPTIYFGLLTGLAMFVALAGNLLLLPAIILVFKPVISVTHDHF